MDWQDIGRRVLSTAFISIAGFTIVLTAAFVGLVALVGGDVSGIGGRLHYYVLALALFFLLSLWQLDDREYDGVVILTAAMAIGVLGGVIVALATEGVVHALREPSAVIASELFAYFVAAAMICTGLGVWIVRHWRELAGEPAAD